MLYKSKYNSSVFSIANQLVFASSLLFLLFFTYQNEFISIWIGFTIAFLAYIFLISGTITLRNVLIIGISIRIISVFSFPNLSDDIYRYIWDGIQWNQGQNPFSILPAVDKASTGFEEMLVSNMNSPEYYGIYPPILQILFAFITWLIPAPLVYQIIGIKSIMLIIDILGIHYLIRLLKELGIDPVKSSLYILNPLVIVELMGNMHMELIMISFFIISFYFLMKKKNHFSSLFWAISVLSKMITGVFLPFLFVYLRKISFIKYAALGIGIIGLSFVLMLGSSAWNIFQSLDLYFQKFEFNASIYFIFRQIGYWFKGYNLIHWVGPILAFISGLAMLYFSLRKENSTFVGLSRNLLFALTTYFLFSTTVHPWYISTLVLLSVFTNFRYAILWSYLVVLSYSLYSYDGNLYYYMIAIEYAILYSFMTFEYKQCKKRMHTNQ